MHDDAVPDTFMFNPQKRCASTNRSSIAVAKSEVYPAPLPRPLPLARSVKLQISKETLEKAARRAKRDFICALPLPAPENIDTAHARPARQTSTRCPSCASSW